MVLFRLEWDQSGLLRGTGSPFGCQTRTSTAELKRGARNGGELHCWCRRRWNYLAHCWHQGITKNFATFFKCSTFYHFSRTVLHEQKVYESQRFIFLSGTCVHDGVVAGGWSLKAIYVVGLSVEVGGVIVVEMIWHDITMISFTLWLFNIAMESGPFIYRWFTSLPIKNSDFPWLC